MQSLIECSVAITGGQSILLVTSHLPYPEKHHEQTMNWPLPEPKVSGLWVESDEYLIAHFKGSFDRLEFNLEYSIKSPEGVTEKLQYSCRFDGIAKEVFWGVPEFGKNCWLTSVTIFLDVSGYRTAQ